MTDSRAPLPRQDHTTRAPVGARPEVLGPASPDRDGAVLHVRWSAQGAVAVLSGEVDMTSRDRVEAVGRLLAAWGQPPVVDASGVSFIDLAGLDALGALGSSSRAVEPVLVVQPSASLLRLLRVLAAAGCGPSVRSLGDRGQAVVLLPELPRAPRSTA